MDKRWKNIITAFAIAFFTALVVFLLGLVSTPNTVLYRILQIAGSVFPGGIVQFFTFWLFYFGMLEIWTFSKNVNKEERAYEYRLLPEREQYILTPKDVNDIKLKVLELERKYSSYELTKLIKKACTKYRANKSTTEAMEIVNAQVRINLFNSESEQSMIRYVAWAIPSVGFIGTIVGIAGSLGNVKSQMSEKDIEAVTQALYTAFDTTLLSLFLSILLMFYFHTIQEKVESFHSKMEEYVIENLINRIYK